MDLRSRILSLSGDMTNKQSQLSRYVLDHVREAALMNSTQLAFSAKVSESTITRFVYMIGYRNFNEFQLDLRRESQRANYAYAPEPRIEGNDDNPNEPPYKTVFDLEMNLMSRTFAQIDEAQFNGVADALCDAKELLLIGNPMHSFLTNYANNFISLFRENVHHITGTDLPFTATLGRMGPECAALVFCYPRYPTETLKMAKVLAAKKVRILGITDSPFSPLVQYCQYYLTTPQKYLILGEANSCVVALIHSLFLAMYRRMPERVKANLKQYEEDILDLDMFALKDYNFEKRLR